MGVTTTTVTHKTEQETMAPNSNKIPCVCTEAMVAESRNGCIEEGVMTTCDAMVNADGFFDFANWAVDIGFEARYYTLLDEGQKLDVEIKTQLAVQARMKRSGIIEGKFGNTKAHGFTGRRARRGVKGYLIVRVEFTDGMLGTEISELTSSIISQPVTFRIYGSSVEYSSTSVTTVDKREKQMAYPAPQSNDAVKADIEASMTTLPPDAGMTAEQLKAKEKADREKQKELQDQLDAVSESQICVDDEGKILDETECAEFKNQQGKEVIDKKADSNDAKCESISGKTITDAAKCSEIVVADGKEKQAKAAYLDCMGDINNKSPVADCAALKKAYTTAQSAATAAKADEKEELSEVSKSKSTTVVVIVIVCVIAILIIIVFVVYIKNHHAFDDVYGTAGMASYNNPVYGGAAPAGAD